MQKCFDIRVFNRLGVDHVCDRQMDGHTYRRTDKRTEGHNYDSNSVHLKTCAKKPAVLTPNLPVKQNREKRATTDLWPVKVQMTVNIILDINIG